VSKRGTGKTLVGLWLAETLAVDLQPIAAGVPLVQPITAGAAARGVQSIVVFVPTLTLIRQVLLTGLAYSQTPYLRIGVGKRKKIRFLRIRAFFANLRSYI
jgi:hypothetical protein